MTSKPLRRLSAALLCAAALTACSSPAGTGTTEAASAGTGPAFSFDGARGDRVELDTVPTRILADEGSASALIPLGIRPVGIWSYTPPADSLALQGLDLTGIESVGEVYGEVDVEKAAALDPDLIVTGYYPLEKQLSGISPDDTTTVERLGRIAPIATVNATNPASTYIEEMSALAGALGADPAAAGVAESRAAFDAAVTEFRAAVAAKPGLTVSAVSSGEGLSIANPPDFAEFLDLTAWGLDMQVPAGVAARGYFETVSWENAPGAVTGDLLFFDSRPGFGTLEDTVAQQPTWALVPAHAVTVPWYSDTFTNYANYAKHLTAFTAAIEAADPDLVP